MLMLQSCTVLIQKVITVATEQWKCICAGVFLVLQSTGFLNAMETRYIADQPPIPEVPIVLFLATISIVNKYEFNKQSASLMRPLGSSVPDAKSFINGIVSLLHQVCCLF